MKLKYLALSAVVLMASTAMASPLKKKKKKQPTKSEVVLANANDSVSYAIGISIAGNIGNSGIEGINTEIIGQAILDSYNKIGLMKPEEVDAYIQGQLNKREEVKTEALQATERKFLSENATKPGVVATPEGVQYKVLQEGFGLQPGMADTVVVHYKGSLIDGTTFDSSYDRNEPIEITAGQVIPGWGIALQLMRVGSKFEVYIPSELAYGPEGVPGAIPPYSTLVFEMELLDVKPATK
jgi:FKBP-type peptidyl-prolyl cis-trans isomerase FklB